MLRRLEAYPDLNVKALTAYLDHPAPRSLVVLVNQGLKARDLAKHPVWSRLQRDEAAVGFFRLREEELYQWLTREAKGQSGRRRFSMGPGRWFVVEQEPGSGGKDSADATIRNLNGFKAAADRPTGDKTLRAEPIGADRWQGGNVRVVSGAWSAAFLSELEMFPSGTYRDQVDALSGAYKCLMELVSTRRLVGPVSAGSVSGLFGVGWLV